MGWTASPGRWALSGGTVRCSDSGVRARRAVPAREGCRGQRVTAMSRCSSSRAVEQAHGLFDVGGAVGEGVAGGCEAAAVVGEDRVAAEDRGGAVVLVGHLPGLVHLDLCAGRGARRSG